MSQKTVRTEPAEPAKLGEGGYADWVIIARHGLTTGFSSDLNIGCQTVHFKPMVEYGVVETEDVPITDLSEVDEVHPDLNIRQIDRSLGLEQTRVKLWYFEPGEEFRYHAHADQEEVYYIVEGEFSLKLGRSGEEEFFEVGPGTFWAAGPEIGHGHRYLGDDRGVVLAIGAPAVDDPGLDPHQLD